jgi:hypothetical protein
MRFVGTVVYAKRWDHDPEGGPATEQVTDVRLSGEVSGQGCWFEVSIPTARVGAYPIGRRVVVTVRPA